MSHTFRGTHGWSRTRRPGFTIIDDEARCSLNGESVALHVYLTLLSTINAGDADSAWMSRTSLAEVLGHSSTKGVDRALHVLEGLGLVARFHRFRRRQKQGERYDNEWSLTRSSEFCEHTSNGYFVSAYPGEPFDGVLTPEQALNLYEGELVQSIPGHTVEGGGSPQAPTHRGGGEPGIPTRGEPQRTLIRTINNKNKSSGSGTSELTGGRMEVTMSAHQPSDERPTLEAAQREELLSPSPQIGGSGAVAPETVPFGFHPPVPEEPVLDIEPEVPVDAPDTPKVGGTPEVVPEARSVDGGAQFERHIVDQSLRLIESWDRDGRLSADDRRTLGPIIAEALVSGVSGRVVARALVRLDDGKTVSWNRLRSLIGFEDEPEPDVVIPRRTSELTAEHRKRMAQQVERVQVERADGRGADSAAAASGYPGGLAEVLERLRNGTLRRG